ncbi:MAG: glycosyltransferase family 4 protein [Chloroflexi bacterium]|nr:glycosyltransferase family 4 protein [Chloroflexota bacterium]
MVIVVPSSGAFDARAHRIAVGLAARGHEVTVIARAGADLPMESADASGYAIRRAGRAVRPDLRTPLRQMRQLQAIAEQRATAIDLVPSRPDVVHAMGLMGLPIGLAVRDRLGGSLVYDARDLYPEAGNLARMPASVRHLVGMIERRWARRADRVFTVNDALAGLLQARLGCAPPVVVMNASDPRPDGSPGPRRFHERLGLDPAIPIVLYQGGFSPGRGIGELIEAMSGVPGAHLVLLGYGRLVAEFRARVDHSAAASRISLLPAVAPAELLEWVASADVVVIPIQGDTLNHRLATPNKLFEALAAGVPVVASDLPGMAPIVRELDAGVLVDPSAPASIAAGIRTLLEAGPEERDARRHRIQAAAASRYGWQTQFAKLLAEYERLTGRPW